MYLEIAILCTPRPPQSSSVPWHSDESFAIVNSRRAHHWGSRSTSRDAASKSTTYGGVTGSPYGPFSPAMNASLTGAPDSADCTIVCSMDSPALSLDCCTASGTFSTADR